MVKKNYRAWRIDPTEFSNQWPDIKKLQFFARYAILAPSGHNTQPWEITAHEKSLTVSVNQSHFLSADGSGLLSVEPYISIGTFLEVLSLAAQGYGYKVLIRLFPRQAVVAEITIGTRTTPSTHLLTAITERVSNRHPFKEASINKKLLVDITKSQLPSVSTVTVTNRSEIDFIADQTKTAVKSIMRNPLYRIELSKWVRTNFTRAYDGMPGFTHGFGGIMSLISKLAVRHALKYGPQAEKSANLIRKSGALVIVSCTNNQEESFVNAGRLFSQICVLANDANLATSALGASVIDARTREKVKQRFQINDRPIYILRLGKPTTSVQHSPRWPLEKVLNHAIS